MRRFRALILTILLASAVTLSAQDVNKARQLLEQALAALQPAPAAIATPEAFDQALAAAVPGAVLQLDPALVYTKPLTIRQAVTLQSAVPAGRVTRDVPLPSFRGGLAIAGDDVTLIGLEVRHPNPLTDIVTISGEAVTLDRVRVLGDPVKGAKRGIAANANGNLQILRSYVDDAFQSYPGNDSQAIIAWDMAPGLLIEDCYLSGGSETVMIGGADPASEGRIPTHVIIRGSTITKNPAWQALPIGVKNTVEIKAGKDILLENNDISYSWGGHGQDGYAFVATVRNQDNRAPFSTIQDVTVKGNRFAHAAAAINLLGLDTTKNSAGVVRLSVRMARVTIQGNTWTDLNPKTYTGATKLILIDQAPEDVTIDGNGFDGAGYSSIIYFGGGPAKNFTFTNNRIPRSTYGIFGGAVTAAATNLTPTNPAWLKYTLGGTIANNVVVP